METLLEKGEEHTTFGGVGIWIRVWGRRGTSLIRNGDPPQDHHKALGMVGL